MKGHKGTPREPPLEPTTVLARPATQLGDQFRDRTTQVLSLRGRAPGRARLALRDPTGTLRINRYRTRPIGARITADSGQIDT